MLVTFLFWNVFKRPLETRIARIAAAHSVDVLMLAECETEPSTVLKALNLNSPFAFYAPQTFGPQTDSKRKIKIFTRLPPESIVDQFDNTSGRLTIRRLTAGDETILLCVVHLVSKTNYNEDEQLLEATVVAQEINFEEEHIGRYPSIVVGDFNMNPFEKGMVSAHAFHAVMTQQQAIKQKREVQGREYRYFYNPMWGYFGDRTGSPAGTYYFNPGTPIQYFWNIYDQVLLRPALIDRLVSIEILTSDGEATLLTPAQIPDKNNASDHLPLLFRLNL